MKIAKETAQELAWAKEHDGFKVIERNLIDHSRWSVSYSLVIEKYGHFYSCGFSRGATECQDESPFEYENDPIEFEEVFPVQKTITVYEPAPKPAPATGQPAAGE